MANERQHSRMENLRVKNLAQIRQAEVEFGDLTLLVGPQASGKSVFLQLFKLLKDHPAITSKLKRYGFEFEDWGTEGVEGDPLLTLVFGEGMGGVWRENTQVDLNGWKPELAELKQPHKNPAEERVFFIPAQRVLTLDQGRPRSFESFDFLDPFAVKSFSEKLRMLMEQGLGGRDGRLFPLENKLKKGLRERIDESIFHGAEVHQEVHELKKRVVLNAGGATLPYMAWSAGQREFMPLLFGLYWLMPSGGSPMRAPVEWVIIEEPEMGLHPQAIQSVLLICLELISRGYRVVISTHSPLLLEAAWAIRTLQETQASSERLHELFDMPRSGPMTEVFDRVLKERSIRSYFFEVERDQGEVTTRDISSLDPFDEQAFIADWGGLTAFSSRVSDVISEVMQEAELAGGEG